VSTGLTLVASHEIYSRYFGLSSIASTPSGFSVSVEEQKIVSFPITEQPEAVFLLEPIAPGLRLRKDTQSSNRARRSAMSSSRLSRRMISAYADIEPWKEDHDRALFCYAVEDTISWGLLLFQGLSEEDANWHTQVLESKIPYDEAQEAELIENYRNWLEASNRLLPTIGQLEEWGFEVREAHEFRKKCQEARGVLTEDVVFFVDEALVNLRDEAIDEHRRGATHVYGGGDA
jgi:hypothetical protein